MNINAIVPGSLSAVAQRDGMTLAETFLNCDVLLLVDQSGSMSVCDAPGGTGSPRSRYDAADAELTRLQAQYPGKVALVAFSSWPVFCPGGKAERLGGGTDMAAALQFVKVADDAGIKIVLISDGEPNEEAKTLQIAKTFKSRIDTIYIGSEEDHSGGRAFLQKLAQATGGQFFKSDAPGLLADNVQTLLLAG